MSRISYVASLQAYLIVTGIAMTLIMAIAMVLIMVTVIQGTVTPTPLLVLLKLK